ncbi:MAG: Hpt domain-containing protein [Flavobacteriales bacterium]
MRPASRPFRLGSLFLLLTCLFVAPVLGQSHSALADSVKKVVADQRSRMHLADSTGDARTAVDARLTLAGMVKGKEALRLLEEAVAKADSAYLLDVEAMARTRLAEQYERMGNHREAYEEAMRLVTLGDERLSLQAMESGAFTSHALSQATAERDSLQRTWRKEIAEADEARGVSDARTERWMWITTGIGALCLIMLVVFLYRSTMVGKRTRSEIDELRAEIVALRTAPKNRLREEPTMPVVPDPPVPVAADTTKATALDDQVLAFFQKMAPERLRSLRDARSRGDNEKVVRVVHTLKPQLNAIDPVLYGDLCAAITAKDAVNDLPGWNADLDRLEAAVERLLQ